MPDKLQQLKAMTDVVADTGDIEAIRRFEPEDATTNPSLLLKAAALPHYRALIAEARDWAQARGGSDSEQLANCSDRLAVAIGREILDDLEDHLAESAASFVPTRIDHMSMQGSPLPALMMRNEPGVIQVLYQVRERGVELYVFDENGALCMQWAAGADEFHLLIQQQRFLDSFASRRVLNTLDDAAARPPEFARIAPQGLHDWQVTMIKVPRTRITDHTELTLTVSRSTRLQEGFRLQLGNHEFDSLLLGDDLYPEVAAHLRRLRSESASPCSPAR